MEPPLYVPDVDTVPEWLGDRRDVLEDLLEVDLNDFECVKDLYRIVSDIAPPTVITEWRKSKIISTHFRIEGNKLFQKGMFLSSLTFYNISLFFYPFPKGCNDFVFKDEDLSFIYGNQSAALFELNHYREALEYIERSLACGYPTGKRLKLWERKVFCLCKLGRRGDVGVVIQEAEREVKSFNMDYSTKAELLRSLKSLHSITTTTLPDINQRRFVSQILPELTSPDNVCSLVMEDGRLAADKDIQIGEIVCAEEPVVEAKSLPGGTHHCGNCWKHVLVLTPCRYCPLVGFCSPKCSEEGETSHRPVEHIMAAVAQQEKCFDKFLLSLHIILKTGMSGLRDVWDQLRVGCEEKESNVPKSWFPQHPPFTDDTQALLLRMVAAKRFTDILETTGFLPRDNSDDVLKVFELLLRNLLANRYSRQRVTHECLFKDLQIKHAVFGIVGRAIYPNLSNLKHSCIPNCLLTYVGSKAILIAIDRILEGDELTIDFLNCPFLSSNERIALLKSEFHIRCSCPACRNEWFSSPLHGIHITKRFVCRKCYSFVKVNSQHCENCSRKIKLPATLTGLSKAIGTSVLARNNMNRNSITEVKETLVRSLKMFGNSTSFDREKQFVLSTLLMVYDKTCPLLLDKDKI